MGVQKGNWKMNILKKIKKNWLTFWMISALLTFSLVGAYVAYSAYMGNSELKRLVSTKSISDVVFSSNVMKSPAAAKNIHATVTSDEYEYPVTVCNFEQMSPANYAKEQIVYNLTAELVKLVGDEYKPVTEVILREDGVTPKVFSIKKTGDNNTVVSKTEFNLNSSENGFKIVYKDEILPGTSSVTDTFTIVFDREELSKENSEYFIKITATPVNNTAVSGTISEIGAWVSVCKGKDYSAGWKGSLIETDNKDYDAYNMQVYGSGAGTIEIRWDSRFFSISDMFLLDELNKYENESGIEVKGENAVLDYKENWKKVILKVDSYTQNKYDIQFFKTQEHTFTEADPVSNYIEAGEYKEKIQQETENV